MIIYGSRSKQLAKEILIEKCPHCGTQNSIDMHVFQKYAHVFWIPLFPLGKQGVSQCDHCKQVLKSSQMPSSLLTSYENLKATTRTPFWMWIGLALLGFLFVSIAMDEKEKTDHSKTYIKDLKVNDILQSKVEEGYTRYKVKGVKGDSVFIVQNKYFVPTSRFDKLSNSDANFYEEGEAVSKKELEEKFNKKEILDVIRN